MTRFDDIQARHAKAIPGPWERDPWEADADGAVLWNIPAEDWEFIAHCPNDVRWLLDRVTRLTEELTDQCEMNEQALLMLKEVQECWEAMSEAPCDPSNPEDTRLDEALRSVIDDLDTSEARAALSESDGEITRARERRRQHEDDKQ